eukprot:GHVS01005049.1.p1 GENE.GHVS01005049.1~~GHVS01005049.1.p1  ORF type:complete len:551 (-),score=72.73 GHVS01005049.1:317-1969(-)
MAAFHFFVLLCYSFLLRTEQTGISKDEMHKIIKTWPVSNEGVDIPENVVLAEGVVVTSFIKMLAKAGTDGRWKWKQYELIVKESPPATPKRQRKFVVTAKSNISVTTPDSGYQVKVKNEKAVPFKIPEIHMSPTDNKPKQKESPPATPKRQGTSVVTVTMSVQDKRSLPEAPMKAESVAEVPMKAESVAEVTMKAESVAEVTPNTAAASVRAAAPSNISVTTPDSGYQVKVKNEKAVPCKIPEIHYISRTHIKLKLSRSDGSRYEKLSFKKTTGKLATLLGMAPAGSWRLDMIDTTNLATPQAPYRDQRVDYVKKTVNHQNQQWPPEKQDIPLVTSNRYSGSLPTSPSAQRTPAAQRTTSTQRTTSAQWTPSEQRTTSRQGTPAAQWPSEQLSGKARNRHSTKSSSKREEKSTDQKSMDVSQRPVEVNFPDGEKAAPDQKAKNREDNPSRSELVEGTEPPTAAAVTLVTVDVLNPPDGIPFMEEEQEEVSSAASRAGQTPAQMVESAVRPKRVVKLTRSPRVKMSASPRLKARVVVKGSVDTAEEGGGHH